MRLSRYLAAFGPATIDDMASWIGVPTPAIRAVLDEAPRTFATKPAGSSTTSRAHRDRPKTRLRPSGCFPSGTPHCSPTLRPSARILPERYRRRVIAPNGDVAQTILVDGFVAGTWKVEKKRLRVEPFARLAKSVRDELAAEEERLLAFLP